METGLLRSSPFSTAPSTIKNSTPALCSGEVLLVSSRRPWRRSPIRPIETYFLVLREDMLASGYRWTSSMEMILSTTNLVLPRHGSAPLYSL